VTWENVTRGNLTRENVTRGNEIRGNVILGNVIRGNVIRGNVIRGNVIQGNLIRGNVTRVRAPVAEWSKVLGFYRFATSASGSNLVRPAKIFIEYLEFSSVPAPL
jgi:hypothetical protein